MEDTAAYPDYATGVVVDPVLNKRDMVPSVVGITDGPSIPFTGQTTQLESKESGPWEQFQHISGMIARGHSRSCECVCSIKAPAVCRQVIFFFTVMWNTGHKPSYLAQWTMFWRAYFFRAGEKGLPLRRIWAWVNHHAVCIRSGKFRRSACGVWYGHGQEKVNFANWYSLVVAHEENQSRGPKQKEGEPQLYCTLWQTKAIGYSP